MKTSRTTIALSIAVLTLAAAPLAGCSKRADASTQAAPSGSSDSQPAPAPTEAPAAGSSDRSGDGAARAKEGRGGRRHGGKRGERAGGKQLARLREILAAAGVSREQSKVVFQRLRAERTRGGAVRAEQVLADVLPSFTPDQREEATRIVRESADAPADD